MSTPGPSLRAPLLWLLVPFMTGIALADRWPATAGFLIPSCTVLAAALALLGAWLANRPSTFALWLWPLALIAAGTLTGYIALHVRSPRLAGPAAAPREVVLEIETEQLFPSTPQRKTLGGLGRIVATDGHLTGLIGQRVYFSAIKKISVPPTRSGRYQVRGVLQPLANASNTGTESAAGFQRYLESAGIRLTLKRAQVVRETQTPGWWPQWCGRTEHRLETILRTGIERHPTATSLYLGMLLGEKATLDEEQKNAFMRSGTFHIFCIAGLHIGVIATAIFSLLQLLRLPPRWAIIGSLLLLWCYVQVIGANVPTQRAFLMIAFLRGARLFRQPGNSLAALAAAALLTLCLEPRQLFSAGFQMSYAVVGSLIVMAAPLARRWETAWQPWRDLPEVSWGWPRHAVVRLGRTLLGSFATTWVALLASTPSTIGYFNLFSPGALLANLFIVPMAMLAIIAGVASLIGGLCHLPGLSVVFNHAAVLIIETMDWLMVHGTELPGVYYRAQFVTPALATIALTFLMAVIFAGASLHWPRRWGATWWPALAVTLILFFGVKLG